MVTYPDFKEGHTGWSVFWTCNHHNGKRPQHWTKPQLYYPDDEEIPDECLMCGNEDIEPIVQLVTKGRTTRKYAPWD